MTGLSSCSSRYEKYLEHANKGAAEDQEKLARLYLDGDYVDQSTDKAMIWYVKSAFNGNPEAQYRVSRYFYTERYALDRASGLEVLREDYSKAAYYWARRSSEQGHLPATARLAKLYVEGVGIEKNTNTAYKLLLNSLAKNDPAIQYQLGLMYLDGKGVEANTSKAFDLFKKSADQGYLLALLDYCYYLDEGKYLIYDPELSFKCYINAVQYSPSFSDYVAEKYAFGKGVKQDNVLAYAWYLVSLNNDQKSLTDIDLNNIKIVKTRLSSAELYEAKYLASEWREGNGIYRNQLTSTFYKILY